MSTAAFLETAPSRWEAVTLSLAAGGIPLLMCAPPFLLRPPSERERGGQEGVRVTSRSPHQLNVRQCFLSAELICQGDGQDLVFVLLTNQQMFNLKMRRGS